MTSFFLLAVELLVILCSQSEVCTVVETSYFSASCTVLTYYTGKLGQKKCSSQLASH